MAWMVQSVIIFGFADAASGLDSGLTRAAPASSPVDSLTALGAAAAPGFDGGGDFG